MKRFLFAILVLGLCLGLAGPAFAKPDAKSMALKDAAGTSISSYALTSGAAVYSESIYVTDNIGFASLLIVEDKAGGLGDVDISVEYSVDGTNWYTAYTADQDGTITVDANIYTTLRNISRWLAHVVRLAPWMRYKFDPDADAQITATVIFQRDR